MSNKTYKDEKGAIYTEDRKILLQIPRGTAEFVVPEGTEEIGEDVSDDELRNVTLPLSLRKIWPHAFNCCMSLEDINIPASVRTIEHTHCASSVKHLAFKGEVKKMPNEPIYELFANIERITIPHGTSSHYAKLFRFVIEEE